MDSSLIHAALCAVAAVVFYAILARGLFKLAEPFRLRAMEIAERFSNSPDISREKMAHVYDRLGEVYSSVQAWKLVYLLICVFARRLFGLKDDLECERGVPAKYQDDEARLGLYWMASTIANSPAATVLFATLMLMGVAFTASLAVIAKSLLMVQGRHAHHGAA